MVRCRCGGVASAVVLVGRAVDAWLGAGRMTLGGPSGEVAVGVDAPSDVFPTCTQFRAGDRVGYESEGVDPGWAVGVVTRAGVRELPLNDVRCVRRHVSIVG